MVRIWEAEVCKLHAVGEAAPGLLGPVAWQPSGRHLYAAQAAAPAAPTVPQPGQQAAGRPGHRPAGQGSVPDGPASGAGAPGEVQRVVLFERNGLLHGGLDVASTGDQGFAE